MKLLLDGIDTQIVIESGRVSTLEIENATFFARICQSLLIKDTDSTSETLALWSDSDEKLKLKTSFLVIVNPFDLPFKEKLIAAELYKLLESLVLSDGQAQQSIDAHAQALVSELRQLTYHLQSNYEFELQWDLRRYLKAYAFGVDYDESDRLIDNLIKFLSVLSDISFSKILAFVNLKTFLDDNDIQMFYDKVFLYDIPVLLLERARAEYVQQNEQITTIDKDFLEHSKISSTGSRSSAERIVL